MRSKVYAQNKSLAFEVFEMATMFNQMPSDVALLDESVNEFGRQWFNIGVAAFGRAVQGCLNRAGQRGGNAAMAQTHREWEWERIFGADSGSASYADPGESTHARVVGRPESDDDDDEILLED